MSCERCEASNEQDRIDEIAQILIDAYCESEELDGIVPSYVATFVDMARAVVHQAKPDQLVAKGTPKVRWRTGVPFVVEVENGPSIEVVFTKTMVGANKLLKFEGQDVNSWMESNNMTRKMLDGLGD